MDELHYTPFNNLSRVTWRSVTLHSLQHIVPGDS